MRMTTEKQQYILKKWNMLTIKQRENINANLEILEKLHGFKITHELVDQLIDVMLKIDDI